MAGTDIAAVTESAVAGQVVAGWDAGRGGWIVTVNVDILRAVGRDPELAELVSSATLAVADGMPLVWASRLAGDPLPERVTGASLVSTLAETAARCGRSLYLLGGDAGVAEAAAAALAVRFPGTRVVGTDAPPFGFDTDEEQVSAVVDRVVQAAPDLVLVGLGFPKQERLIGRLRPLVPRAWLLGCGAGIPFAAGQYRRAPDLLQRVGAEWAHRLALEPRRLARRYLVHDLPFALDLLSRAAAYGFATRPTHIDAARGKWS
ncbi:N-acetylglucosaminyldiphosphoundecaprenol N-acetyl-beta-D-mannosaminyltransferase [Geodermatophilus saharensis]|uniref:N-acetylglucosaminyldiphosphoundecaprenol N-acetyl-beta-D-mannosaminyltransferase n=1 Tax=Geodermatophilus saharensis TaxID=1137994 RepID=A0A239GGZ8_9ACTN|nr:WecB/TagA/CpsF family glycosyltransferase [Geodermatophilus saharensis]SNS67334.1 N-acetylglucosaminyldiphosphoundecaprenol N-acetyl-beta-D-mannosaminyltransferase [Geodermatophilus saharensis]